MPCMYCNKMKSLTLHIDPQCKGIKLSFTWLETVKKDVSLLHFRVSLRFLFAY